MAARRTGRIPAELVARHVVAITEGGDWLLRCAAMEAILRRCKFGDRDGLVVTRAPAGSVFGSYVTGRMATSGQAAPRRQTSAKKRAGNAEPRPYRTVLTRLDPLEGNCDCPDYLRGSLGLCKHLIRVLDVVHAARGSQPRAATASASRHATLSWDPVRPLRGAGERLLWRRSSGSAAFRSRWARSEGGADGSRRALGRRERRLGVTRERARWTGGRSRHRSDLVVAAVRGASQAASSGESPATPGREDLPVMRTSRPLWTSRSAMAVAAAALWNRLPQSLKARLVVTTVEARM
jgi:hypothetical protein